MIVWGLAACLWALLGLGVWVLLYWVYVLEGEGGGDEPGCGLLAASCLACVLAWPAVLALLPPCFAVLVLAAVFRA